MKEPSSIRLTATAMLSAGPAKIHHRYLGRRAGGRPGEEGEVVVTGPGDDPDAIGQRGLAATGTPVGVAR